MVLLVSRLSLSLSLTVFFTTLVNVGFCSSKSSGAGDIVLPKQSPDGGFEGDQYFQYINVPAKYQYEWGYRRGNEKHNREQSLSQRAGGFKAKVHEKKLFYNLYNISFIA